MRRVGVPLSLIDLHATYQNGNLWLDCPCSSHAKTPNHRIRIVTDDVTRQFADCATLGVVGKFPHLTLHRSVEFDCGASFGILNGEIKDFQFKQKLKL